ncbi:UDP-N-acetylmuramoyl-L-alanyl-D-glutamate--2,6-diaminopimelate ligase, partial [Acidithiobacillus sp. MC2.1]|nr:UDP-N-acetylmuramoyl-L-alanyl-D-glutamate--2,6-diaminopimelate ligase [Acidithiobacillus sp. MC2.2]
AAIRAAIAASRAGDWVLIAGKGHERTQEIMGQRQPVPQDRDVATEALRV